MRVQRLGPVLVRYLTRDDAQNFKEADHPRKHGQFVKKGTGAEGGAEKTKAPNKGRVEQGAPFHPQANAPVGIKQMHQVATHPYLSPDVKLKQLKAIAESKSTTPTATAFYHKYLGQMEAAVAALHAVHGGSLSDAPGPAAEEPASAPSLTPEPKFTPPTSSALEQHAYILAVKGEIPALQNFVNGINGGDGEQYAKAHAYGMKLLSEAGAAPEPEPAKSTAEPTQPTQPTVADLAKYGWGQKVSKKVLDIASSSMSDDEKKSAINGALNASGNYYTSGALEPLYQKLGIGSSAPAPKAPPSLTSPHPDSNVQKQMHELASDPHLSDADKKQKIPALAVGPNSKIYAQQLLKELGIADAPSTSQPQATAPGAIVSKRPSDQKLLARFASAIDLQSAPLSVSKNFIPMSGKGLTDVLTEEQHSSIKSYTGTAYSLMNKVLRDPVNTDAPEHFVDMINHIDEAFEHPQARVTSDIQLHRNMALPTEKIDEIVKSLEKGLPTKMMMHGFVSTSTDKGISMGSSGNIRVHMLVEKGARAMNVKSISEVPSEDEILLPHGQHFSVVSAEKKGSRWHLQVVAHP